MVRGHMSGRSKQRVQHLLLYVDDATSAKARAQASVGADLSAAQWASAAVSWSGYARKGKHKAWLASVGSTKDVWGCGKERGALDVVELPVASGAQVYKSADARAGCPPKAKAQARLLQRQFRVEQRSLALISGRMTNLYAGRTDLYLYVDNLKRDAARTHGTSDAAVFWSGAVPAGVHTAWLQADRADAWGCPANNNNLAVVVLPAAAGVGSHQAADTRDGCPPQAKAQSRLLHRRFRVEQASVVIVTAHMARLKDGAASLLLYVDGSKVAQASTYTPATQWADTSLFYAGLLKGAGLHEAWLQSEQANAWGCGHELGDLDVVTVPQFHGDASSGACRDACSRAAWCSHFSCKDEGTSEVDC